MRRLATGITALGTARARRRLPGAAALGSLAALGQAPLGWWPATLIGFALIFGLFAAQPDWRRAAWLGWAAGTGHFLLALSWLVEPFLVDAARHAWMAPFALFFMAAGLALFWAAGFALARVAGGGLAALALALTLAEAARTYAFTGFPWAEPGHAWIGTPVMQWAALGGALALCLISFALAALLWQGLRGRLRPGAAGLAALAALWLGGGAFNPAPPMPADAPTIRLVQPNAAQHEKWNPEKIPVFYRRQLDYTAQSPRPDLVVWPETAIPVMLNNAAATLDAIDSAAGGAPVVLGVQRFAGARLFNSLVKTGPGGTVDSLYDKYHLVPFGEYIPFGDVLQRFGLRGLAAQQGHGYSSGPGPQIIGMGALGRALPLICYEGVFPQDVSAAPGRADFMLLITNDAWFGQVSGPYQHLAQARLRSVEQGLPMVRAANTGISAVIDARGALVASLPLGQAGWLDAPLPPPAAPPLYARMGDMPVIFLLLLGLGVVAATQRRII